MNILFPHQAPEVLQAQLVRALDSQVVPAGAAALGGEWECYSPVSPGGCRNDEEEKRAQQELRRQGEKRKHQGRQVRTVKIGQAREVMSSFLQSSLLHTDHSDSDQQGRAQEHSQGGAPRPRVALCWG